MPPSSFRIPPRCGNRSMPLSVSFLLQVFLKSVFLWSNLPGTAAAGADAPAATPAAAASAADAGGNAATDAGGAVNCAASGAQGNLKKAMSPALPLQRQFLLPL
jgi:hypothetical protein